MADNLRDRIAAVTLQCLRQVRTQTDGSTGPWSFKSADGKPICYTLADAVIRGLEADYILVPRSHTLAKAAEEWLKSDD